MSENNTAVWALVSFAAVMHWSHAFDSRIDAYPVRVATCGIETNCGPTEALPHIQFTADSSRPEVIWLNKSDNSIGTWRACTIADKENWKCDDPRAQMINGYLQSPDPSVHYTYWVVWRFWWVLEKAQSFFG